MAEVNPYVNTEGRTLTIYTRNGDNWSPSRLPSGMGATLSQDGSARNIWDSGDKTVKTSNKLSGTAGWILPSPSDAGDINSVNVIIINNSNINHVTSKNVVAVAGQTIGTSLPLGITTLGKLVTGVNTVLSTVLSTTLSSSDRTNQFQILPLPDQIVRISSGGVVTVTSLVGTRIPKTALSIHNCFNSTLFIRMRPCDGSLAQNIGQIAANQTIIPLSGNIGLNVYSTYQLFLESGDGMTVSGFFDVPSVSSVAQTIFFRTNGAVSNISCSGSPIPPPGPTPPPVPPLPVVKTVQTTWNTAVFPANGTGACAGDTTATASSVVNTIPIRIGDTVRFVSSDGQSHNLVHTNSSWIPQPSQEFPTVPPSNSFNHSIIFTRAGCFYFISNVNSTQSGRMRLRISITDTNGNGGCTTVCPGIPDVPVVVVTPAVVVPADDDLSFLERWWWAILICTIIVILIICLIVYLVWYNNKTPTTGTIKTTTVTHTPVVTHQVVQPAMVVSKPAATFFTQQGLPPAVYSTTGSGLVPAPAGILTGAQGVSTLPSAPAAFSNTPPGLAIP